MDYDLGYFDLETRVLEPLENPFGRKVTYVLDTFVTHVSGPDPAKLGIPRSTLDSKIKQLKAKKHKFNSE
jgi:hypothetical protein